MNYKIIILLLISLSIYMIFISSLNDIYARNGIDTGSNNFNQIKDQIAKEINQIRINGNNNDLLQLISASFGGAISGGIVGGFVSSYLNARFSNRAISEKEHLSNLNKDVTEPLRLAISNYSFHNQSGIQNLSTPLMVNGENYEPLIIPTFPQYDFDSYDFSTFFSYDEDNSSIKLRSDNFLFQDLIYNHYPLLLIDLERMLQSLIKLSNAYSNLKKELEKKIDKLKGLNGNGENEHYHDTWLNTLQFYILNREYDKSFFRITDYPPNAYLYISNIEKRDRPFGIGGKNYLVYESLTREKIKNQENVTKIQNQIISNVESILNEINVFHIEYINTESEFENARKLLLCNLLKIKYSTKLSFVKEGKFKRKKRCSLTM